MTEPELGLVAITEQIADWRTEDLDIRLEERLLANVQLTGSESKNGHRYAISALQEATALYARKPVFLDHAANLNRPLDRSTRDLAGWIVEARFVDGRIRGDLQVLDTEAGRTLLALMSSAVPAVGMSHVILARKNSDGTIVEHIQDVISVDAVVFPATTTGLREQEDDNELASDELDEITAERDALRLRCTSLETEITQLRVERELATANLPAFSLTEAFRDRLVSINDPHVRSRLIAEQRDFVLRCRQRAPCSRARRVDVDEHELTNTRLFVQAVKQRR